MNGAIVPNDNPRLAFGRGVYMRCVLGDTFERVTQGGTHVAFVTHVEIEYESSLPAEYMKARSFRQ